MSFIPAFPMQINVFALFGLILLLGLIGGEIARRTRFFPRILGYVIIGYIIGPEAFNLVNKTMVLDMRAIIDISLGLILFDLGRHLEFTWLRHDKGLLLTSMVESALTFISISAFFTLMGLPWLSAALAGTIAITTSPAITMMIAKDLSSEGPVTRRTLILTSLNNFLGLIIFSLLIPFVKLESDISMMLAHVGYRLLGSIILGLSIFILAIGIAYFTGKHKETQFIMFICMVVLAISFSRSLNFSTMLTLLIFGVAARNFDYKNVLMEVDFGWLAHLFLIPLFVITGIYLQTKGLLQAPLIVLGFILIRMLAKALGIILFAKKSYVTKSQALMISLALTPIAGVAIGMANILIDFNPELGGQLTLIITTIVTVLEIAGAIATQYAFVKVGEAKPN